MIRTRVSAAKNGSPEGSTRHSPVNHQLDRIDVGRIVGGEEKHGFGQLFRFAPMAQRNSGGDEISKLCRLLCRSLARAPRFQMGVFVAPGATTFTRMLRGASRRRWHAPWRRGRLLWRHMRPGRAGRDSCAPIR